MQSIVLRDYDRLRALGASRSFNIIHGKEVYWHVGSENAFKFIVVDDCIVIAPIETHIELYVVYRLRDLPLEEARTKAQALDEEQESCGNPPIRGAGTINAKGEITSWSSAGFRLTTPKELRGAIENEIAVLRQKEELTIRY